MSKNHEGLILAAIDIGSNAARLLITEVKDAEGKAPVFNKLNLFRIPLRLGFDVFDSNFISPEKSQMFIETMQAFRSLMNAYQVDSVIACATSAMRDAENANQLIAEIYKRTGIQIEVISGDMEANLIYENHIAENMDNETSYLYIDVGGGSTELSFFSKQVLRYKNSFNIGTIRILQGRVKDKDWQEMKESVKSFCRGNKSITAIGSGGNINKIFSLSKRKEGKPLTLDLLRDYYRELSGVSLEDRISKYNLRADRADVIVPALTIYIQVMRWAGANDIYVPKIGLADGLIRHLHQKITKQNLSRHS